MGANSGLEEKTDEKARHYYKRETPFCEAAGKTGVISFCWGQLEWAHIVSRGNRRLRYESYNKLILCHGHHDYWTNHPADWKRFVRHYFPDRWREVQEHEHEYQNVWAGYYEEWLKKFN